MKKAIVWLLAASMMVGGGIPALAAEEAVETTVTETVTATIPEVSEMFSNRDREGSYEDYVTVTLADGASRADGAGVTVEGDVITVTGEGTYLFCGTLTNGQIVVNPGEEDKVQLVLAGADITCRGGAALYILEGDKIFLTMAPDTENRLASAGEFVQTDENTVDGAVFAKSDLTMNGTGSLAVDCEAGHGVVAKDDLKLTGGVYTVTAANKGFEANDSFRMADGDVTITAGADGVQVENEEDLSRGYVHIAGGSLTVNSTGDGVSATGVMRIMEGVLNITTTDTVNSSKGLKSDHYIEISGGDITLTTADDGVHTNGDVLISGGTLMIYTADDAVHADSDVNITGGHVEAPYSFEGVEGTNVNISGGYVSVVTTDDGINAGGGADGSGFGGRGSSFEMGGSSSAINISGGEVHVNAEGDGLDANGSIYVTGGAVYVNGPTTSFNGTLDFDAGATVTGGTVVATGPNSWLQNFGAASTQGSILCTFSAYMAPGTEITLTDNATGEVILSYTAEKYFQSVILSDPAIVVGGSYTVTAGEESQTVEMTSLLYGGGGGMGGGKGGDRGGKGGRW